MKLEYTRREYELLKKDKRADYEYNNKKQITKRDVYLIDIDGRLSSEAKPPFIHCEMLKLI